MQNLNFSTVKAIEQKIKLEVSPFNDVDLNAPPSPEAVYYLSKLNCLELSEIDKEQLLCCAISLF